MTKQEIRENNKLIAEFMGAVVEQQYPENEYQDGLGFYFTKKTPETIRRYSSEGLKYHCDWIWLMEVVEKIREYYNVYSFTIILNDGCDIILEKYPDPNSSYYTEYGKDGNNIECVYKTCIKFISSL